MIGAVAATVTEVFKNPVVSTLVGFIPDIADRVADIRYRFVKSKRLDALIKEYANLADAADCPTLARLLRTKGVTDELDASCGGSLSKELIADRLLSNASIPEGECATQGICLQFVSDYFDAKTWIDDENTKSAVAILGERITSCSEDVNDKLDHLSRDLAARNHDTSLVLSQLASGQLTYKSIREYVRLHGRDSLTGRMMGLYCDVLDGSYLDSDSLAMS